MLTWFRYFLLFCIALFSAFSVFAQFAMPDSVCIGDLKHYNVDSNLVSGSTYVWKINGVIQISSANDIDITWNTTGTYLLEVQELSLGGCLGPVKSGQVFVSALPFISIQPSNQTSCAGVLASFTVTATGSGLTYQWRRGTTNLVDGGNISGSTTTTLTIYPVNYADTASNYNVVVTGTCSPAKTSVNASLVINITGIGTYVFGNSDNAIIIYPNPFNTLLTVDINNESKIEKCDLMIFNVLGENVLNRSITKQHTTLETAFLPSGIYFYRVINKGKIIQSGKLISQR